VSKDIRDGFTLPTTRVSTRVHATTSPVLYNRAIPPSSTLHDYLSREMEDEKQGRSKSKFGFNRHEERKLQRILEAEDKALDKVSIAFTFSC